MGLQRPDGPDVDSTAHVLQLFSALALADADVGGLMNHRSHGQGFSTYRRPDGWGEPHPDVTAVPVPYFGMPVEERIAYGDELADWLLAQRDPEGFWPSYWWRGPYYATYWSLRLLRATGRDASIPAAMQVDTPAHALSCFELGWAVGILAMDRRAHQAWQTSFANLVSRRRRDGSWPGSDDLRVTDSRYRRPWSEPPLADDHTRFYVDVEAILTRASILRALTS